MSIFDGINRSGLADALREALSLNSVTIDDGGPASRVLRATGIVRGPRSARQWPTVQAQTSETFMPEAFDDLHDKLAEAIAALTPLPPPKITQLVATDRHGLVALGDDGAAYHVVHGGQWEALPPLPTPQRKPKP